MVYGPVITILLFRDAEENANDKPFQIQGMMRVQKRDTEADTFWSFLIIRASLKTLTIVSSLKTCVYLQLWRCTIKLWEFSYWIKNIFLKLGSKVVFYNILS